MKNNKDVNNSLFKILDWWRLKSLEIPDNIEKATACISDDQLQAIGRAAGKGYSKVVASFVAQHGDHIVSCGRCRWILFEAQAEELAVKQGAEFEKKLNPQTDLVAPRDASDVGGVQLEVEPIKCRLKAIIGGALAAITSPEQLLATAGSKSEKKVKGWRLTSFTNTKTLGINLARPAGEIFLKSEGKIRFQKFPLGTEIYIGTKLVAKMQASFVQIEVPITEKTNMRIKLP